MPLRSYADEGALTLTVTPPLFQLGLQPGETWSSSVQIVNPNPYDITVRAEPTLFRQAGATGRPEFYARGAGEGEGTIRDWIIVPDGPIQVLREQTYSIPLYIKVPENAPPGGHYASILVGNRAPKERAEGGVVQVSSSIAVLLFVRIAGDVDERGRIREFSTEQSVYDRASARLTLKFENQGNVHIQPRGNIVIYNMFGKQRGMIPVNHASGYGNVLPGTIRDYAFVWESNAGWWDIGRYRAEATIGYGEDGIETALAATYFYVLPIKPLAQVLGALLAFILFVSWSIRAYVRKALAIERARMGSVLHEDTPAQVPTNADDAQEQITAPTLSLLARPIEEGIIDLRRATRGAAKPTSLAQHEDLVQEQPFSIGLFVREYRNFFIFIGVSAIGWFAVSAYFADVLTYERPYTVIEERSDGTSVQLNTINNTNVDE
jgi:hypothetical protein